MNDLYNILFNIENDGSPLMPHNCKEQPTPERLLAALLAPQTVTRVKADLQFITKDGRIIPLGGPGAGGGEAGSDSSSAMPKPSGKGVLFENVQAQPSERGSGIYVGDEPSIYHAEIYPDGIRIFGMAVGKQEDELIPFDYTFKVGDPVFSRAGQLPDQRGPLISVGQTGKSIVVQNQPPNPYHNTNSRLNLYQFIYANAWGNNYRQQPRMKYNRERYTG